MARCHCQLKQNFLTEECSSDSYQLVFFVGPQSLRQEIHNTSLTFRCLKLQSGWGRPVINSPPNIILFFKKNIQVWSLYSLQFCTPQVLVLILKTLTPKFEVVMFLEDSWQVSCYNLPANRFVISWMLLQIELFTMKTNLRFPLHPLQKSVEYHQWEDEDMEDIEDMVT